MTLSIGELQVGEKAVIRGVLGGMGIVRRLEAMGLRSGKSLTKISSQFLGGPVTIIVDGRYVALGRGIAAKVMVEREPLF